MFHTHAGSPVNLAGSPRSGGRLVGLAIALLLLAGPGAAQVCERPLGSTTLPPNVLVDDSTLIGGMTLLVDCSPSFRASLDSLAVGGRMLRIATYAEVGHTAEMAAMVPGAYARVLAARGDSVYMMLVAVDVRLLATMTAIEGVGAADALLELAVILGHEIFGHVSPILVSGDFNDECPDHDEDGGSCSVSRENIIRAELGVPPRSAYTVLNLPSFVAVDRAAETYGSLGAHNHLQAYYRTAYDLPVDRLQGDDGRVRHSMVLGRVQ